MTTAHLRVRHLRGRALKCFSGLLECAYGAPVTGVNIHEDAVDNLWIRSTRVVEFPFFSVDYEVNESFTMVESIPIAEPEMKICRSGEFQLIRPRYRCDQVVYRNESSLPMNA